MNDLLRDAACGIGYDRGSASHPLHDRARAVFNQRRYNKHVGRSIAQSQGFGIIDPTHLFSLEGTIESGLALQMPYDNSEQIIPITVQVPEHFFESIDPLVRYAVDPACDEEDDLLRNRNSQA